MFFLVYSVKVHSKRDLKIQLSTLLLPYRELDVIISDVIVSKILCNHDSTFELDEDQPH